MFKKSEIVNPNAKWVNKLQNTFEKLDEGKIKNFPLISKQQFDASNSKEQIRLLKSKLGDLLKASGVKLDRNFLCPFHLDNSPSMVFNREKCDIHCYGCMDGGHTNDIFDLLSIIFGIKSFTEQKIKAIELLVEDGKTITSNMRIKSSSYNKSSYSKMDSPDSAKRSLSSTSNRIYVPAWEDPDCMRYIAERGITLESAKKFNLKSWEYRGNKYLIIPSDDKFNIRRKFKDAFNGFPKFWNKKDVPITLFNSKCLGEVSYNETIFVVESATDAILIEQMNLPAIAINGVENYTNLIKKADIIKDKNITIAVMMDNDKAGFEGSMKFCKDLNVVGVQFYMHLYQNAGIGVFLTKYKDITEAYIVNREKTIAAIKEIYEVLSMGNSMLGITGPALTKEEENLLLSKATSPAGLEVFGFVAMDKLIK